MKIKKVIITLLTSVLASNNYVSIDLPYAFFKKHHLPLTIMTLLLVFMTKAQAQQLSFSKTQVDQGYNFQYQWLDHTKTKQAISFTLNQDGLFERFRNFRTYQDSYAQKTILKRIKKKMQQSPIQGVQIFYRQQQNRFVIEAKGSDRDKVAKAYQTLARLENEVRQQYLEDTYYQTFTNHEQINGIKVDHVSIANNSVIDLKPLKPLILDHVSIKNIRKVTNYVLGFVQSIPYNTLDSRLTSSGAGFNPPLQLLWENQGDCDSKMTLTAALLRALMPRIDMALIYIDGHAFIGINIEGEAGEVTITHNKVKYLLAEPTGPALLPLGTLAPESELAINQGHYIAQDYHVALAEQKAE
ncbi:hypothetical protein [Colwellia psychrerythraea]|uniref:Transglutaminase domain-containing protein n=1 Tax=Colwellia psychrerythraea (strain 34H / ATCC BAA-681) TaxID=167879 RepID=Q47VP6_COLP3|nr:hypothetical protein [Colwellia psychrerythraea]AAZ26641.1 hypothetical protein CPS_4478 [Colwellia psychrerythraea 34H]